MNTKNQGLTGSLFGLRPARSLVGLWIAALGIALPGLAAAGVAGVITTRVTTLSTDVTYASVSKSGVPLETFIGYEFIVSYTGTNTTNNVVLQGHLMVTDADELATLTLDTESSPPFCKEHKLTDRIELTCVLGQLRSGTAPIVFPVFFKAPRKVDNSVGDGPGEDLVALGGTTYYAEGNDGAGNTNNSVAWTGPLRNGVPVPIELVTLGTSVVDKIKSVVTTRGGTFYSGNAGVANPDDDFATKIKVPAFSADKYQYTVATIDEKKLDCANSPLGGGPVCLQLDLAVLNRQGVPATFPDSGPLLSVLFSIDKTLCPKSSCRLDDLKLRYEDVEVQLCSEASRTLKYPCLVSPLQRVKNPRDKDSDGDIEAESVSTRNGRFTFGP